MCNAHNHPLGCMCGWGGDGNLGGHYLAQIGSPVLNAMRPAQRGATKRLQRFPWLLRGILLFETSCWWCAEAVYFYRNADGGCVLFDQLGYPWPIHSCWEQHKTDSVAARSGMLARYRKKLEHWLISPPFAKEQDGSICNIKGNWFHPANELDFVQLGNLGSFAKVEIFGNDQRIYPVLFPEAWLNLIEKCPVMHFDCEAVARIEQCFYFPLKTTIFDGPRPVVHRAPWPNWRKILFDSRWVWKRHQIVNGKKVALNPHSLPKEEPVTVKHKHFKKSLPVKPQTQKKKTPNSVHSGQALVVCSYCGNPVGRKRIKVHQKRHCAKRPMPKAS